VGIPGKSSGEWREFFMEFNKHNNDLVRRLKVRKEEFEEEKEMLLNHPGVTEEGLKITLAWLDPMLEDLENKIRGLEG